ncbi:MAG: Lsm family RNA-binding protein [Conexivisphaerales archaeon]
MSTAPSRRFIEELGSLIGRKVTVETSEGKKYKGVVLGLHEDLSTVLGEVEGEEGTYKVIINGNSVKEIKLIERPFDLKSLAEAISRVFPGLVKLREDIGAIIVMDKIKVTESGVVEGSGPSGEKVRQIYEEYVKSLKKVPAAQQ